MKHCKTTSYVMERIIECVPNFSEGRDKNVVNSIAHAISSVGGSDIKMLGVESGKAANRTVITFAGRPEDVVRAAFEGVRRASELIDMRKMHGEHPRIGATDVLPLVPIRGVSLEECVSMARHLAGDIFARLGIPCYCYEAAAFTESRRRLENCRRGEYESLPQRIADPERRPDFSSLAFDEVAARCGATIVGARRVLVAVNFNLDTTSVEIASRIAGRVRESGHIVRNPDGTNSRIPGLLPGCKAIGWYIEEYGFAQVSMNITDTDKTSLYRAFSTVCNQAAQEGVKVTGTEIIGLVPEQCILDAGLHVLSAQTSDGRNSFLSANQSSVNQLINAIQGLGLSTIRTFIPEEKIIEYKLK